MSFVTDYQVHNGNGRQPAKVMKDTLSSCNQVKFPWVFHQAEEIVIILVEMIIKRCDLVLPLFQRCHSNLEDCSAAKQTRTKANKTEHIWICSQDHLQKTKKERKKTNCLFSKSCLFFLA